MESYNRETRVLLQVKCNHDDFLALLIQRKYCRLVTSSAMIGWSSEPLKGVATSFMGVARRISKVAFFVVCQDGWTRFELNLGVDRR